MGNGINAPISVSNRTVVVNFPNVSAGGVPTQNKKSSDYTLSSADLASKGAHVYHPSTDNSVPRIWTVPSSHSPQGKLMPVGDGFLIVNGTSALGLMVVLDTSDGDTMFTEYTAANTSITVPPCTSLYLLKVTPTEWRAYPGA